MDRDQLPKNDDMDLDHEFFRKLIEHAFLARLYIALLSVILVCAGFSFTAARDQAMFGVDFLPVGPAFWAAGVTGLLSLAFPRSFRLTVVWVLLLGLACVGRMVSVVFSDDFTAGERLRSTIWFVVWIGALVCVVNIQAARVLRETLPTIFGGSEGDQWSG